MELKDTKIVFHELCIKMMICYSLKFSVSLFNIHTRVLQTQFHAQEKCRNREHCQAILIFACRFDKSRTNIGPFSCLLLIKPQNPCKKAFYSFFEYTFQIHSWRHLAMQLVTFFLALCSSTNKNWEKAMWLQRFFFMSRWQRHGKTIQWLMRSHVSTLNVSWPVLHICWLCHITAGFYGKRISQLCNINDKGAANEREKIRQPTCLSANLRLTKTLAPLARNYKIRLPCSSPPTSKFLIIFCGKNLLISMLNTILPALSLEDSSVKGNKCCLQQQI